MVHKMSDLSIDGRSCTQHGKRNGWTREQIVKRLRIEEHSDLTKLSKRQLCQKLFDHANTNDTAIFRKFQNINLQHTVLHNSEVDVKGYQMEMIWFCASDDSQCIDFYQKRVKEDVLLKAEAVDLVLLDLKAFLENQEEKRSLKAWLDTEGKDLDTLKDSMDSNALSGLGEKDIKDYTDVDEMDVEEFALKVFDIMYQVGPNRLDANRERLLPEQALVPLSGSFIIPPSGPKKGQATSWDLKRQVENRIEITSEHQSYWFKIVPKEMWEHYTYRAHMAYVSLGVAALIKDYCKYKEYNVDGWYHKDLAFPHRVDVNSNDGTVNSYTAFFHDANEILLWNFDRVSRWSIGENTEKNWDSIRKAVFDVGVHPSVRIGFPYKTRSSRNVPPTQCKGVIRPSPYKTCKWWHDTLPAEDAQKDYRAFTCAMTFESIIVDLTHIRWGEFYSRHSANLMCVLEHAKRVTIIIKNSVLQHLQNMSQMIGDRRIDLEQITITCNNEENFISSEVVNHIFRCFNSQGHVTLRKVYFGKSEIFDFSKCDAVSVTLNLNLKTFDLIYFTPFMRLLDHMPNVKKLNLNGCTTQNFHDNETLTDFILKSRYVKGNLTTHMRQMPGWF